MHCTDILTLLMQYLTNFVHVSLPWHIPVWRPQGATLSARLLNEGGSKWRSQAARKLRRAHTGPHNKERNASNDGHHTGTIIPELTRKKKRRNVSRHKVAGNRGAPILGAARLSESRARSETANEQLRRVMITRPLLGTSSLRKRGS